ncbi:MAG TPA: hypothetical protein HPP83_01475 [Candidatus Hydrogenedentes bacterium]|nr:hypothetical protein [Candidatus Hydrogenedentota bacterium]
MGTGAEPSEPNIERALTWWEELPDIWTPVGWKHHLFRFNVLFNGMISAANGVPLTYNNRTTPWADQGVQLWPAPSSTPTWPARPGEPRDNNLVLQGWQNGAAPVLWSEWVRDGLVLRQDVFAHVPGGKAVESGIEPLFAWIRLTVHDAVEGLPLPDRYGFSLKLNAPYVLAGGMITRYNRRFETERAQYPRALTPEPETYDAAHGWRLLELDGKVRLAVAPGQKCALQFLPNAPTEQDTLIFVEMDAVNGRHVDLLLPMLPEARDVFDGELALGYDAALEEANRFWAARPETAARFDTPEPYVNEAIQRLIDMTEMITEKDPATGHTAMLAGSWKYELLWPTPVSMNTIMLMDIMGYHDEVEQTTAMYKSEQGTIKPPGDHYQLHPGYLASPKTLTSVDWLSDHGAILWTLSQHALLTGRRAFIEEWTPVIVKACEFIQYGRRIEGHGGVPGLLAPGVATDTRAVSQATWNDGWNYKGLTTAVRLLKRIGHPCAAEFADEAEDYKKTFQAALRTAAERAPTWTDAHGAVHHMVPHALSGAQPHEFRHAFYLDTGPLFLVFAGLMDANDDLMQSTLRWFREGPPTKVYRYDSECWQLPSLRHEMSSCEPCYSWNVFHSHQTGDRARFLEGMYSLFAGQISRRTFTACETRGGTYGTIFGALPVYLARLAVIDDQIEEDAIHLLRMMPLAWLRTECEAAFENMPTEFGPITLRARLDDRGNRLRVTFEPQFRETPNRVMVHIPPLAGLSSVTVNGKELDIGETAGPCTITR